MSNMNMNAKRQKHYDFSEQTWDILDAEGVFIDTGVFDRTLSKTEVRRMLVDIDGYPDSIVIRKS